MCGIDGVISLDNRNVASEIFQGLKRLEYRGYDSVGEATIDDEGRITIKKDVGGIEEVQEKLRKKGEITLDAMEGSIGIGHTRWATHGAPSTVNAHPHISCKGDVAIVHNGIFENFVELGEVLSSSHKLRSSTDSELAAHLIEDLMDDGRTLREAVRDMTHQIRGSYALAVISSREPNKIVVARNESPLEIGIGERALYVASDKIAFFPYISTKDNGHTGKVINLEDGLVAELNNKGIIIVETFDGQKVKPDIKTITFSSNVIDKGGYKHWTLKEIQEQPISLRNSLRVRKEYLSLMTNKLNEAEEIIFTGCGTSYHACLAASYAFDKLANRYVTAEIASELIDHHENSMNRDTIILAVSQSGYTADVLDAVREAKIKGAQILALTNTLESALCKESLLYISQNSGPEFGVAATKTYTAQYSVLFQMGLELGKENGSLKNGEYRELLRDLHNTPKDIEEFLRYGVPYVEKIAEKLKDKNNFVYLGRGINYSTILEGRLKLTELTSQQSLAYAAGESKHGMISVIESGYPVIFTSQYDKTRRKIIGNIQEMKARGAKIISIAPSDDKEVQQMSDIYIGMNPNTPPLLTPLTYVVPLQLFAYFMADKKGKDPDRPQNLAKSVTVK